MLYNREISIQNIFYLLLSVNIILFANFVNASQHISSELNDYEQADWFMKKSPVPSSEPFEIYDKRNVLSAKRSRSIKEIVHKFEKMLSDEEKRFIDDAIKRKLMERLKSVYAVTIRSR